MSLVFGFLRVYTHHGGSHIEKTLVSLNWEELSKKNNLIANFFGRLHLGRVAFREQKKFLKNCSMYLFLTPSITDYRWQMSSFSSSCRAGPWNHCEMWNIFINAIFGSVTSLWTTMYVCVSVGRSVQKKLVWILKFLANVAFVHFFLKSPPLPFLQIFVST